MDSAYNERSCAKLLLFASNSGGLRDNVMTNVRPDGDIRNRAE
jgi:hypothetical protein